MHKSWNVRGAAALFALCATLATTTAQSLVVTPGQVLRAGQVATITYSNASLAGQCVTIEIAGGFPVATVETVVIKLDANGVGTGSWTANSAWFAAGFNAPGVAEVMVMIKH